MISVLNKQPFAVKLLKSHLEHNRVAHTYLLSGTRQSGKEDIAMTFACALNCEAGRSFQDCSCPACHKIVNRIHPDVHWLGEDLKARSIKIEDIRNLKGSASLKSYEGRWKVFIVVGADRLTDEAQNALLKTLEEPPDRTVLCLLVENKSHLFETIRSRAFEVRLRPADDEASEIDGGIDEILQGMAGPVTWEDLLGKYQTSERDAVKKLFDLLMECFNARLKSETLSEGRQLALIEATERLYETKEALEDNTNQKLALSRLAMQLRRILPLRQTVLKNILSVNKG